MFSDHTVLWWILGTFAFIFIVLYLTQPKNERLSPWGLLCSIINQGGPSGSPAMICPHCQIRGSVSTRKTTRKKGISGGKATGALLTGGVSLLATGLSRKEKETEAHCASCHQTWHF